MTCKPGDHDFRPKGKFEVCEKCKTRFPCEGLNCGHVDCWLARGRRGKLPGFISRVDGETVPGWDPE